MNRQNYKYITDGNVIRLLVDNPQQQERDAEPTLKELLEQIIIVKNALIDEPKIPKSKNDVRSKKMYCINGFRMDIIRNKYKYMENIKKERDIASMKLQKGIPNAILIYIILSSAAVTFFATCLILAIKNYIYIINPMTSFLYLIGTLGLLITSLVAAKDWRDFLKDV